MSAYDHSQPLPAEFSRTEDLAKKAILLGLVLAAVSIVASGFHLTRLLQTYLVGYLYWTGISLGCLGLLLLHYLVGGIWGFLIRRPSEIGASLLPLLAVLFVPIAIAILFQFDVYPWAIPNDDEQLREKARYLNPAFFLIRTLLYFAIWIGFAMRLSRGMREQDQTASPLPTRRLQRISGPGLAIFFVTFTFAAMDWGMSLEPDWYSTIYGVMLLMGAVLATLSFLAIVTARLKNVAPLSEVAIPQAFHDIGNLMLAFTMLWAYLSFSQYLVVYSGNVSEEIPFYLRRSVGGWWPVAASLILFQFFTPFFLLLGRDRKRNGDSLARVGIWILVMHLVDLIWLVIPAFARPGDSWSFLTVISKVAGTSGSFLIIGGLWMAVFLRRLRSGPLLPSHNDPLLEEVFEHQHAGHGGGH